MDREIPKEVRNKERNKKIIRYGGMGAAGIVKYKGEESQAVRLRNRTAAT